MSDDTIYRQAARGGTVMTRKEVIGELRELKHMFQRCYGKYPTCLEEAIDYIYQTPQHTGRWVAIEGRLKCSACGFGGKIVPFNFCPNCGADMRGEQDG